MVIFWFGIYHKNHQVKPERHRNLLLLLADGFDRRKIDFQKAGVLAFLPWLGVQQTYDLCIN